MEEVLIHMFPTRSGHNAYIDLLSNAVDGAINGRFVYRVSPRTLPSILSDAFRHRGQKRIIHIHWPTVLYGSKYLLKSVFLFTFHFAVLGIMRCCFPCRIVWTKHNEHAHDYPHPWIDRIGSKVLFYYADAVIIQQKSTAQKLSSRKIRHIPHGNYCDTYGPVDREVAQRLRRSLHIADHAIILLALGTIKPYKKIDAMIDVFNNSALHDTPNLHLVIAGECKESYRRVLQEKIGDNLHVLLLPNHIADHDIPAYLGMSDYAVFWYDNSVLTSGGIILALSYGVPVIARQIPAADMIVHGENGLLYETAGELSSLLLELPTRERMERGHILESVKHQTWKEVARMTTALYSFLFV